MVDFLNSEKSPRIFLHVAFSPPSRNEFSPGFISGKWITYHTYLQERQMYTRTAMDLQNKKEAPEREAGKKWEDGIQFCKDIWYQSSHFPIDGTWSHMGNRDFKLWMTIQVHTVCTIYIHLRMRQLVGLEKVPTSQPTNVCFLPLLFDRT